MISVVNVNTVCLLQVGKKVEVKVETLTSTLQKTFLALG